MNPILKVSKTLIRCPKEWLPDETSNLAVAIRRESTLKMSTANPILIIQMMDVVEVSTRR